MNIIKKKIAIVSVFMCFTILAGLLNGWNFKAGADDGYEVYWKYTYKSGGYNRNNYIMYTIDDLPIIDNIPETRAVTAIDNRENAPLEQQVVSISKDDGTLLGTGFIIGDHEIMTAAHCVTTSEEAYKMEATDRIITIPTANPSQGKDIKLTPEFMTVPEGYFEGEHGMDYAIVKVKEDLSKYGKVYLGIGTDESIKNTPVHTLGYTCNSNGKLVMKIASGNIGDLYVSPEDTSTPEEIAYKKSVLYITTAGAYYGTSGGPLYTECKFGVPNSTDPDEKIQVYKTVIGIVTGGPDNNGNGIATRMRPEILNFVYNNPYLT